MMWAQCNGPDDTTTVDWEDTTLASCCDIMEEEDHRITCVPCPDLEPREEDPVRACNAIAECTSQEHVRGAALP